MKYASLRQGLLGAWCPSLGATGYRLLDRSGRGNHGTLTNMDAGTDWVGGPRGPVLDFDGANDHVSIGNIQTEIANGYTLSAWIKYTASHIGQIISRDDSTTVERFFQFRVDTSNNTIRFVRYNSSNILVTNILTAATVNNGKWRHVLACFGLSFGSMIFVDGLLSATDASTTANRSGSGSPLHIASRFSNNIATNESFNGQMDDVRFYIRALNLAEIRLLASEPGIGLRPERVSVYFGESLSSRRRKILTGLT